MNIAYPIRTVMIGYGMKATPKCQKKQQLCLYILHEDYKNLSVYLKSALKIAALSFKNGSA